MSTEIEPTTAGPGAPAPDPLLDEIADILDAIRKQNEHIIDSLDAITARSDKTRVNARIVDFNMPFVALVGILVKVALASIPALIILGAVILFFLVLLSAVLGIGLL